MVFRCRGKEFFLTYPRVSFVKTELMDFIKSKGEIIYVVVCEEAHEDGSPHMHAAMKYKTRRDFGERSLDFQGAHPCLEKSRNFKASITYVKKDGQWEEDGTLTESPSVIPDMTGLSYVEWLRTCLGSKIPFGYAQALWTAANVVSKTIEVDYVAPGVLTPRIEQWMETYTLSENCSIVMKGPSGIGKTTAAVTICPKPLLFVTHMDDLKELTSRHKGIVFDDVSFSHLPRDTQLSLVDRYMTRSIHCRHRCATIPAGIVKIFTCNYEIFVEGDSAIERRLERINFY